MMNEPRTDIIAQFDQAAAMFVNLARALGDYYAELIRQGIPTDLAETLVSDAQRILLTQRKVEE